VAVILGVLLGLPGLFALTPSTEPLRLLPLALIPTAAVPLAIALHVVSLLRLHAAVDRIGTSHVPTPGSLGSPQAAES
jgi:hypothetical protein